MGVFCKELSVKLSYRLPGYCRVFVAEVSAIKVGVDLLLRCATFFSMCSFFSVELANCGFKVSQGMLNLTRYMIKLLHCQTGLSGHRAIATNCVVDELA